MSTIDPTKDTMKEYIEFSSGRVKPRRARYITEHYLISECMDGWVLSKL